MVSEIDDLTAPQATEIISKNHDDLQIAVIYDRSRSGDGKYAFLIFRGPKGSWKKLFSSSSSFTRPEEAVNEVQAMLEAGHLPPELIGYVVADLQLHTVASTFELAYAK